MKKLILLTLLFGILTVGAGVESTPLAPITCDPAAVPIAGETTSGGVVIYRYSICPADITLEITFTEWIGNELGASRPATVDEQIDYASHVHFLDVVKSERVLNSDVEVGENWVEWLRAKSDLYAFHAADWDSKTTAEKVAVLKVKIAIDAIILNGLADLLVTLGY